MTKEQHLQLINAQVRRRRDAIEAIADMTKTVHTEVALLEQAKIAAEAYHMTRALRAEMKAAYPTQCTCACDQHKQEAK